MIQFKRGKTETWRKHLKPLAAGQPGYDKTRHKIKVGDGKSSWKELPFASGLSAEEVLDSEANAKKKLEIDSEDITVFTYGTETPDKNTKGKVYLQYYDAEPEVDYVTEYGSDGIWRYQIWKSGMAKCYGVLVISTDIQNPFDSGSLYCDAKVMNSVKYPIPFEYIPTETVTLQSEGGITWAGCNKKNTKTESGVYNLISPDKLDKANYALSLSVEGYLDKDAWKK